MIYLFGAVFPCQKFVTSTSVLLAVRFFFRVTELSCSRKDKHLFNLVQARRTSGANVFFSAATADAGAFGGVLAYLSGKMDGIGGKRGWE